jgi:hypothetical protein
MGVSMAFDLDPRGERKIKITMPPAFGSGRWPASIQDLPRTSAAPYFSI